MRPITAKLDKVKVYSKGPPSIESSDALITWSSYHETDGKRYISTSVRPMATKLDRVVRSNAGLLSIKSHNLLITWSCKVTRQMKNVINSFSRDLSLSNLTEGWLMIRSHICPTTKAYIPSITTLREFTWQVNFVISLLPRILLLLNLTGWWLVMRSHHSQSSVVLWLRDHV